MSDSLLVVLNVKISIWCISDAENYIVGFQSHSSVACFETGSCNALFGNLFNIAKYIQLPALGMLCTVANMYGVFS
jgi:hypothetical protein